MEDSTLLSNSEVDQKIRRFEEKVDQEMRPQLNRVLKKRDEIYQEIAEYLQLKNFIEMLQTQKLKKYESKVDIGCNVFVTTEVEDTSKIMVALSKDFFVELTQEEALVYIDKKEKYLNEKTNALTKRSCEIKAHIMFVQEAIRELMGVSPDKAPKLRQDFL